MDPAFATVLAAGISAVAAAVLFVVGETLRLLRVAHEGHAAAVRSALEALDAIPVEVARPWIVRRYGLARIRAGSALTALYGGVPRRDRPVVSQVLREFAVVVSAAGVLDQVEAAARARALLVIWSMSPRLARKAARKYFRNLGVKVPRHGLVLDDDTFGP